MPKALVVDSSAIIAIVKGEPDAASLKAVIDASTACLCSMATFVESFIVATGRFENTPPELHRRFLSALGIETVALDMDQAALAADAFLRFGKGRHPAKLNFGDCFSYALAVSLDAPLLFKGGDFARTDVKVALPAGAAS